jgi:hypothetical protein
MAEVLVPGADFDANTPTDDDVVIVPDANSVDVITGLDQKGDYFDLVETAYGYMHNLGAAGTYLQCNTEVLKLKHGGDAWVKSNDNNVAGSDEMGDTFVELMDRNHKAYLTTTTSTVQANCRWHRLQLMRGDITLEADMIFGSGATVTVGPEATVRPIAEANNGNAIPNLMVNGGRVYSTRTITYCTIANAEMDVESKPVTTLIIGAGGKVNYEHTAGTLIVVQAGGHLDFGQTRRLRTITYIIVCSGGRLSHYDSQLHTGTLRDFR